MKRRILSVVISAVLVSSIGVQAYADNITQRQKQAIAVGTDNLTKAEKELADLDAQLTSVNAEIDVAKAEIKSNDQRFLEIQKNIESANVEIETLKNDIEDKERLLGFRSSSIYKSDGSESYMQKLISSNGMSDFIGKVLAINGSVNLDKNALEDLTAKREQLNRRIEQLDNDKEDIKTLTEENDKKIEENKIKKQEMDKLAVEYEKKRESADIDLSKSEKALYEHWKLVIESNKSSVGDLESSISALGGLKSQLQSTKAKKEVDELIDKGNQKIGAKKIVGADVRQATGDANTVLSYAYKFIGYPYVWGDKGPNSFDCSGFVQYVFKNSVGISLPPSTYTQVECGDTVSYSNLQPGDIIFTEPSNRGPEHVGIYIGNGKMINAANPKRGVTVGYISNFMTAKRVL